MTPFAEPSEAGRVPSGASRSPSGAGGPPFAASVGIIVMAVVAAHGLTLVNGFAWDDQHTVQHNAALRGLAGLWRSFSMDDWQSYGLAPRGLYRPLATVSLYLDHALFGFRATGWHATSLALHALTALAITRLARAAGARSAAALVAGIAFAVHPITSEVVDWVSARPDGLAACLVLLALLAAQTDRPCLAAAIAASACFAKEPGLAAVPATLAVVAARAPRRRAVEAAVISVAGVALYFVLRREAGVPVNAGSARLASPSSWPEVFGLFGAAFGGSLRALLWPLPLDAARRLPDLGPWRWPCAAGALALVALAGRASIRARGGLAVALALLVALPLGMAAAYGANLSERYLYLPLAGAVVLLALGLDRALRAGAGKIRPAVMRTGILAIGLVLLAAVGASATRAREWRDPLLIFQGATEADPGNADAWQLFGAELYRHGARREALRAFEQAVALGSARAGLHSNLCVLRRETGDLARAALDCDRAVALDTADPRPRYNRALLWMVLGRREDALDELAAINAAHPSYRPAADALRNLGPGGSASGAATRLGDPARLAEPAREHEAP